MRKNVWYCIHKWQPRLNQTQSKNSGKLVTEVILKSPSRSRKWCFTLHNYTDDEVNSINYHLKHAKCEYVYGKEVGWTGEVPHLQGFIQYKSQRTFQQMKKVMPRAHLESAKGSLDSNFNYCTKEEGSIVTNIWRKEKIKPTMKPEIKLRGWQLEAEKCLRDQGDGRSINWFWDSKGNTGKSAFVDWVLKNIDDVVLFTKGNSSDICSQILLLEKDPVVCIFDFARDTNGHISYQALEELKNGTINSGKYKGGWKRLEWYPVVIVMANFPPEMNRLSVDRWKVTNIGEPSA